MGFMQQEILSGEWYEIDGSHGTTYVPSDIIGAVTIKGKAIRKGKLYQATNNLVAQLRDYVSGDIYSVQLREGYGARLSAPGYMDRTEWSVFDTQDEAQEFLDDFYGEDTDD